MDVTNEARQLQQIADTITQAMEKRDAALSAYDMARLQCLKGEAARRAGVRDGLPREVSESGTGRADPSLGANIVKQKQAELNEADQQLVAAYLEMATVEAAIKAEREAAEPAASETW